MHNVSKVSGFVYNRFTFVHSPITFSHTNPYILNVTEQFRSSYFELGLPVWVVGKMSPVQENVFFSLFNFSCLDATVLKDRQFFFQKTAISNW